MDIGDEKIVVHLSTQENKQPPSVAADDNFSFANGKTISVEAADLSSSHTSSKKAPLNKKRTIAGEENGLGVPMTELEELL
jgi:hypothetical protein